jgi:hypothetical protein
MVDNIMIMHRSLLPALMLSASALILVACGGGGGSSSTPTPVTPPPVAPPPPPPPATTVTISGKATFDRVPLGPAGTGLDFDNIFEEPIRQAVIELVDSTGTVLQTGLTDQNGDYSFSLDSSTDVRVRVRAQLLRTTGSEINVQIRDNTNGNAPYVLEGSLTSSGTADSVRNLNADSGWTGSTYTNPRAAAPFAILDTILKTTERFQAVDPDVDFPELDVLWSGSNRPVSGSIAAGEIGTSSYTVLNGRPTIFILGDLASDTDEFDQHVISHEFGHYFESQLGRTDSIGGSHSLSSRLDQRVAFSEGWGNALSGIIIGPVYRDTFNNSNQDFGFDMESNNYALSGWYTSASVQSVLYDVMDNASDGPDTISDGLGAVYRTFIGQGFKDVPVSISIFAFSEYLRAELGADAPSLDQLLLNQNINGSGVAGTGETNDGGIAGTLPLFKDISVGGGPQLFCSVDDAGEYNRLGNRTFFVFTLPALTTVDITMTATTSPPQTDPDFVLYRLGEFVTVAQSATADIETLQRTLEAGTYLIDAYDSRNIEQNGGAQDSCFTIELQ